MTPDEGRAYVRRIRNPRKQAYAERVLAARLAGRPSPDDDGGLSYMGRQAVEMALAGVKR